MTAVTLDLPDELAARLAALPDANAFATALLREALAEVETPLSQADLDALRRGLDEADAGAGLPREKVLAGLKNSY